MTDGIADGQPERADAGSDRTRMLVGGALATVLLAVIGAAGGWVLAGDQRPPPLTQSPPDDAGSRSPSARATPTPRERPTPTSAPTSATPSPPTGLTVPDLTGVDFEEARDELRERGLGWQLVFGSGDSSSVRSTDPAAGTPVRRGITVKVFVAGAAPPNEVPDLIGERCREAGAELVDDGFSPRFPSGRSGTVTAQDPPGGTVRRWNDIVSLVCGTPVDDDETDAAR
ncbi:PASTA domain-containing protein [Micromonospora radicis]|uniref:PASTA domain-containing protein n=1 Tax=Micromonospora radicis TaxID=1894971 RepID=A0A418MW26_9ACTN|nr:PASTA domain-containing protein [Micromonospora radicis]RIV38988.1 PASTA domain-containing protein [Micromonospora radicis]